MSLYAWRRHPASGAAVFSLLTLAVALWSLTYALELASANLAAKIFWGKIQYVSIASLPLLWFVFALYYADRSRWLTRRNLGLLAAIPVITILLMWTNEAHGLIWRRVSLEQNGASFSLIVSYGGWFWVHSVYSYILLLAGSVVLIGLLRRSSNLYRRQASTLLLGVIIPWIGNGVYISGLSPLPNLDLTPFAFTLSCLFMAWSLFRYRLLDIVPVARRAVVDGMKDGVFVLDAQNRIVDINPAGQRFVGQNASAIIGQPAGQVFAKWPNLVERYRHTTEARAEISTDDERYFDMTISPLFNRHNQLTGRLIVVRDITQQKNVEKALILTRDQALEASRLKTELLARVSHELRTPLNAILGYAEMLEEGIYDSLSEPQLAATRAVINSAQTLTAMVNTLLDQARLEASKLQLNIVSFSPEDLIKGIYPQMSLKAQAKGLTLTSQVAPDLPASLSGDPERLRQILGNLVENAIKFTQHGHIEICLYQADTSHWAMRVSDTGPGIPPQAQALVFEPFRQIDGSTTRKHGGAGLGLSVVKQLATLMEGQIILESEVGRGSTFTILLPTKPVKENSQ